MAGNVLITGGSGTIGRRLTELLQQRGYRVAWLSSSGKAADGRLPVAVYDWNVARGELDPAALAHADYLIHLAGAGIADSRWTNARKQEILESRVRSTELLINTLRSGSHQLKAVVAASAIGYYGGDTGDRPQTEATSAGSDFLARVTRAWEGATEKFTTLGLRTVKLRVGVVLAREGGALPKIVQPIRLGAGAALGSGQQYMSWIHIDDLCQLFIKALDDERWRGVYNAVSPAPVTNATLTRQAAEVLNRPLILPNVPAFALKLAFGEMAVAVLGSSYVLNKRIKEETDFQYQFGQIRPALEDLLRPD